MLFLCALKTKSVGKGSKGTAFSTPSCDQTIPICRQTAKMLMSSCHQDFSSHGPGSCTKKENISPQNMAQNAPCAVNLMQNFWLRSPLEAPKLVRIPEMDSNQSGAVGGPFDKGSHTPLCCSCCCWWTTTGVVLVVLLLLLLLSLRITLGEGGGDPSSAATAHPDATATLKAEQQLPHCVFCMSMLYGALWCSM